MTDCFVTIMAHANQVSFPLSVVIGVILIKGKLWVFLNVVDVMYCVGPGIPALFFAALALVLVQL
ncbi:MAG: hypothetical protein AB7D35_11265 [Bacteroidales bacterium]